MKKNKYMAVILLSILCISCINQEERIIKSSCKNIIRELELNNLSNNLTPCLTVIEEGSGKDSVNYRISLELYQKGVKPIEYTNYFKINGIYTYVLQKNKQIHTISKEMQEELYNWGGGWILETPYYILTINRIDYGYNLSTQW